VSRHAIGSKAEYYSFRVRQVAETRFIRSFEVFWEPIGISPDEPLDRTVGADDDQSDADRARPPQWPGELHELLQITAIDEIRVVSRPTTPSTSSVPISRQRICSGRGDIGISDG
jgi:hypothetical protein